VRPKPPRDGRPICCLPSASPSACCSSSTERKRSGASQAGAWITTSRPFTVRRALGSSRGPADHHRLVHTRVCIHPVRGNGGGLLLSLGRARLLAITNGGEEAVLFCFIFLWLVTSGPGPWSLDYLLSGRRSFRRCGSRRLEPRSPASKDAEPQSSRAAPTPAAP